MNVARINCGLGCKTYFGMVELYVEALVLPTNVEDTGNNLELCIGLPDDRYCIVKDDHIEVWVENPKYPGENYHTWVLLGTDLAHHPWSSTP